MKRETQNKVIGWSLLVYAVSMLLCLFFLLSISGCLYHDPGRGGIEWDRKADPKDYPLYNIDPEVIYGH